MVTARAQGSRVEILSERTEFTTSWANSDGSVTTDTHSGPVRFRDESGELVDIDTTLAAPSSDGTVKPRRHAGGLRLSGKTNGATEEFVTVEEGPGQQVAFGWGKKLPAPTVDGSTATWAEISPGVDMQVHSLPTGFEQTFQVKTRPTGPLSWQFPIRTKGLTPRAEDDGSISFLSTKGKVVSVIPPAFAWDAAVDPRTGDHTSVSPVKLTLTQKSKNRAVLTVTPDEAWASSPDRVLPLTVDPTYMPGTIAPTFDTFVQQGYTTSQAADAELKLGNNGSGQVARSFLRFPTSSIANKTIVSASLNLYATHSWSCSARSWEVWNTNRADTTNATWTTQPSWNSKVATTSTTKGYGSSCANAWVSVPITTAVKDWAAPGAETAYSLGLRATSESDEYAWKKFSSANGSNAPYVSVTWNRPPNKPSATTIANIVAYARPGESAIAYTNDLTPKFTTKAKDDDGNSVRYAFEVREDPDPSSALLGTCTTSTTVASGLSNSCELTGNLPNNATHYVRARANDWLDTGEWSTTWTEFRIGTAIPGTPTVDCADPYDHQSWFALAPGGTIACTISVPPGPGYSAPGHVRVTVDGTRLAPIWITPPTASTPRIVTVDVPGTMGKHSIEAWGEAPAGQLSAVPGKYQFGFGVAVTEPAERPRFDTLGPVPVKFSGPPRGTGSMPTAVLKWRVAGSDAGWNTSTHASVPVTSDSSTAIVTVDGTWQSDLETRDNAAGVDLPADEPVLLEMQACLTYTSITTFCTWDNSPVTVQRVPVGFAAGGPTAPAGPGEVNLRSGEFSMGVTDVSIPGLTGTLDVGRVHTTDIDAKAGTTAGAFGPGWVSDIDADSDLGALQLIDSTLDDGSLVLTDSTGGVVSFRSDSGRRTGTESFDDTYTAILADGEESIGSLTVSVVADKVTAVFTGTDGATTTFVAQKPAANVPGLFAIDASDTDPTLPGAIDYLRDALGRVTHIVAASPGLTSECVLPSTPSTPWAVGCRVLHLVYGPASGGSSAERLKNIYAVLGDGPERLVASYAYDSTARLASATDALTGLATQYTYVIDGALTRLANVTLPGQSTISFEYIGSGTNAKLLRVTRPRPVGDPTGGVAVLASYVYGIPMAGAGLPDLTASAVAAWKQNTAPGYGAAVFGPGHPAPSGTPTATDWAYASLVYMDPIWGRTLNTAVHGAGAWQLTAADYDNDGLVVRELDTRAMALLANDPDDVISDGAGADQLSTQTYYHPELREGGNVVVPRGMLVIDVYGPARYATTSEGPDIWVRPHVHTDYGQGMPVGVGLFARWLPTTTRMTAFNPATTQDDPISLTRTGYAAIQTGDTSGWDLGAPTSVTIDMPGSTPDITRVTRYDADGRVIESRQPMSSGPDAGSRRTSYYTAGNDKNACEQTAWIGLPCKIAPGDGGGSVLTTTSMEYGALLAPTLVTEKADGAVRTARADYDDAGRLRDVVTTLTGVTGSIPAPGTRTKYDNSTGLPVELIQLDAAGTGETTTKQVTGYDSWGRVVSYTPSGGATTTTTYNAAGQVASSSGTQGTTSWTYDGADARTLVEHRGLPTGMTVSNPGGATVAFTAAYDASGALVKQTLPGGLSQYVTYDATGGLQSLSYRGQVTDGEGNTTEDVWLGWETARDTVGRLVREWTPDGAAFTGDVGDAIAYDRKYAYDGAGRLTQVDDRTASTTGTLGSGEPLATSPACQTRVYTFDNNGNRTALTRRKASAGAPCATTGGTATNWTYTGADRLLSSANGSGNYLYDKLGRATTIPAKDTPKGAPAGSSAGNLTIGYYDTDAARAISQNGQTTTYGLDVAGRRLTATGGPTDGPAASTTTRYYTDGSDNPGWVATTTSSGTTITRYAGSLGGVNATITGTAVSLTLINPHGDNITTVGVPAVGASSSIDAWSDADEYGNPRDAAAADAVGGPTGYGWNGASQRGSDETGLILMGARLYNPGTGQFTSPDPVLDGNETATTYPLDPVNMYDVTGMCGTWGNPWKACDPFRIDSWSNKASSGWGPYWNVIRHGRHSMQAANDGYGNFGWEHIKYRHVGRDKQSAWDDEGTMKRDVKDALKKGFWEWQRYEWRNGRQYSVFVITWSYRRKSACECTINTVEVVYWTYPHGGRPLGVKTAWVNKYYSGY